jgi:uncharacterized protein YjbJ (UPF0337 family)
MHNKDSRCHCFYSASADLSLLSFAVFELQFPQVARRNTVCSETWEGETLMNKDILQGKWNQIKGNLRNRWGKLTDNDLERIHGDMEKFIGVIQERYGYKREQAEREVNQFLSSTEAPAAGHEPTGKPSSGPRRMPSQPEHTTPGGHHPGDASSDASDMDKKRKIS